MVLSITTIERLYQGVSSMANEGNIAEAARWLA